MTAIQTPSRRKLVLLPLGILFTAIIIFGVMTSMAPKPAKKPTDVQPLLVEVIEPKVTTEHFVVSSQGNLSPRTETMLISEVSGVVKNVSNKFVVGGFFKKGELLLEIDPVSYEVALLQAQARLDAAKAKLVEEKARSEQAQKEWDMTGRSRKNAPILALRLPQLSQAEADVKAAEADVRNAEIKLARTKIKAPYDAMVREKLVDIGQYATVGSQLAKTFATDYAEVRLPIKPLDLDVINLPKPGEKIAANSEVELTTYLGRKVIKRKAFLSRQEAIVDTTSRVSYLVAQLNDPYLINENGSGEPVPVGSFTEAKIISGDSSQVIKLPREVLHPGNKIYLVDPNNKLKIAVITPVRLEHQVFYLQQGSLEPNHRVITTNIVSPVSGMSLRVASENKQTTKAETNNPSDSVSADLKTAEKVNSGRR